MVWNGTIGPSSISQASLHSWGYSRRLLGRAAIIVFLCSFVMDTFTPSARRRQPFFMYLLYCAVPPSHATKRGSIIAFSSKRISDSRVPESVSLGKLLFHSVVNMFQISSE